MAAPAARRSGRPSLRTRLVAVVLVLLALVATAMGVVSALALREQLVGRLDARAEAGTQRVVDRPVVGDARGPDGPPGRGAPPPGQDVGTVTLDERGGRAVHVDERADGRALTARQAAQLAAVPADGAPHTVALDDLGTYRAVAVADAAGDLVVTGLPTADAEAAVARYVVVEVLVALAALLVAGAVGSVLVRRELRPLERVAATATRVAELPLAQGEVRLRERVDPRDTDPATEVGQVGAALDRMLGHVDRALAERHASESQVRRFVADASHELRTPLASIRGWTELVRRSPDALPPDAHAALARVEAEALRMSALVDDLLLLARLDAGRPLDRAPVDAVALAVDAVADAHAAGPDHVWRLDLPEDVDLDDLLVLGDDHRLRQVLADLTSNARRHTPPGTHVAVTVRREGDDVVLAVADDGPGVPAELRERLFERFARGDASRNRAAGSTGLGLAIARAVVHAHGGTLVCASRPGSTVLTVRLPAAGAAGRAVTGTGTGTGTAAATPAAGAVHLVG